MTFYLWMKQHGEGCDYTIGCGEKLVEINGAETKEQAEALVDGILDYYGINDDEHALSEAVILVEQERAMRFVDARIIKRRAEQEDRRRADKRAQLEKLKRELGE